MSNLLEIKKHLKCFNPVTAKNNTEWCVWEGKGKCLGCQAWDLVECQKARIVELEANVEWFQDQLDQAFSMLSLCGVPKQRAKYVVTGIDVLATRFRKEVQSLHIANSQLETEVRELSRYTEDEPEDKLEVMGYDLLEHENTTLKNKLKKAVEIIEQLADQQAMPDDSWRVKLGEILE